jgi:hypothetical protein
LLEKSKIISIIYSCIYDKVAITLPNWYLDGWCDDSERDIMFVVAVVVPVVFVVAIDVIMFMIVRSVVAIMAFVVTVYGNGVCFVCGDLWCCGRVVVLVILMIVVMITAVVIQTLVAFIIVAAVILVVGVVITVIIIIIIIIIIAITIIIVIGYQTGPISGSSSPGLVVIITVVMV